MSEIEPIWRQTIGDGPLIATAIHDGHTTRETITRQFALDDAGRLREEDPYTGQWTAVAPTRIVGLRSRFEVDLNRPREKAVYVVPQDAWGLEVWKGRLSDEDIEESLAQYDAFYESLREVYQAKADQGPFVVYDVHTYNHRRAGPDGPEADPEANPQVNIGTATLADRGRFAGVIDACITALREFDFPGGKLDVRENVKFLGGNHARWAHSTFPQNACVIAIEFKKFFMDEWTGEPNRELIDAIERSLAATTRPVLEALSRVPPAPSSSR